MSLYDSLSEDQKDKYYEIICAHSAEQQFLIWLNLEPMFAKQVLAALPIETAEPMRAILYFLKPTDKASLADTTSAQDLLWKKVETFRRQEVAVID